MMMMRETVDDCHLKELDDCHLKELRPHAGIKCPALFGFNWPGMALLLYCCCCTVTLPPPEGCMKRDQGKRSFISRGPGGREFVWLRFHSQVHYGKSNRRFCPKAINHVLAKRLTNVISHHCRHCRSNGRKQSRRKGGRFVN